jgi:hypothetical protein
MMASRMENSLAERLAADWLARRIFSSPKDQTFVILSNSLEQSASLERGSARRPADCDRFRPLGGRFRRRLDAGVR